MNMKLLFAPALCATLLLAWQTATVAQTTVKPPIEELFQTETVYSQEKREGQITFGSTFSRNSEQKLFEMPVGFEYGLTDKWQVSLEWAVSNRLTTGTAKTRGPGDLRLGTKYSWMNIGGSNFHAAAGFELGLPTGNVEKELGEGKVEYEPYVVVAKDFPRLSGLQIFSQLGVAFAQPTDRSADNRTERTVEWNNGMFVSYRKVHLTGEINWSKGAGENSVYLTPGIVWKLPGDVEFGFGVPVGLTRDADDFRTIVKFVYAFGGAKKSSE